MSNEQYSAKMTAEAFMFPELRLIAGYILQGLDKVEIERRVFEDNVLQYKSAASIKRRWSSIWRRLNGVSSQLLELIATAPIDAARLAVVYSIAKDDLLFKELLCELYYEHLTAHGKPLLDMDIRAFFRQKELLSPNMRDWTDQTLNKLRQVYLQILVQANMLKNAKDRIPHITITNEQLMIALEIDSGRWFVKMLGWR